MPPAIARLVETNELADKKGLKVGVGLQRRHQKELRQRDRSDPRRKVWRPDSPASLLERRRHLVAQRRDGWSEMKKQVNNWYHFCWLSGDNICEQHVHNLDVCNWAKNAHPIEANGMGGDQIRRADNPATQIFDHHFVEFTYPDGKKMYSQCRHVRNCFERVDEHAFGTKGDGSMQADGGVKDVNGLEFKFDNPYAQEHYTLVDAIRRGLALQRRTLRCHQQHDRRAGTHGHLQRQDRQVGRGCGEGQARGPRH